MILELNCEEGRHADLFDMTAVAYFTANQSEDERY
jgi:hypothetical protein